MADISDELDAMTCDLIGAALEVLAAGEEPAVMLVTDAEPDILTFEDDTTDGCYRAAREYVASAGARCTRYALLYAGVVQLSENDPGNDALLVEFAERGMDCAWSGCVLYRYTPDGELEATDPQPAGQEELLFG